MPSAALVQKSGSLVATYSQLLQSLQTILRDLEKQTLEAAWEMGKKINEHVKVCGGRAVYGKQVIRKLALSLGVSHDRLDQCAQFAEAFADLEEIYETSRQSSGNPHKTLENAPSNRVGLSHFLPLFPIEPYPVRLKLAQRTVREGWSVSRVRAEAGKIRTTSKKLSDSKPDPYEFLKPQYGKIGTYRVLESQEIHWPQAGRILFDHGFKVFKELDAEQARNLKTRQIVECGGARVTASERTEKDRYTYRAFADEGIDGDTFWANLDIGLSGIKREKLRLRGIDCPEVKTTGGKKAKKFVTEFLKDSGTLTVRSSRPAKYDRYEADVFVPVTERTQKLAEAKGPLEAPVKIELEAGQSYYFLNNLLLALRLAVRAEA